jgi:hypothetical protein
MNTAIEFFCNGSLIESREYTQCETVPQKGERLYIEFNNIAFNKEYGFWWIVTERKHLFFSKRTGRYTLQLHCKPDPQKGK